MSKKEALPCACEYIAWDMPQPWMQPTHSQELDGVAAAVDSVSRAQSWPPAHWGYTKTIVGSAASRFPDYAYICRFDYENWLNCNTQSRTRMENLKRFTTLQNGAPVSVRLSEGDVLSLCEASYAHRTGQDDGHRSLRFQRLRRTLTAAVAAETGGDKFGEWFCRLSNRSPKDVLTTPCRSADDAIDAVIRSTRCFDDLVAHRYHRLRGIAVPHVEMHLVPWREDCDANAELRCFVHNRRLVAASHQFPGELFPFLGREKELVASLHDLVQSIYSELMPTATYDSAVIDIEVSDDPYLGLTSQLVEFNPYGKLGSSSPALFDWIDDADLLYPAEGAAALCALRYSWRSTYGMSRIMGGNPTETVVVPL